MSCFLYATRHAIQKIYQDQAASKERTLCVLERIKKFVENEMDQRHPFVVALKNKFNLDKIFFEYLAKLMGLETKILALPMKRV